MALSKNETPQKLFSRKLISNYILEERYIYFHMMDNLSISVYAFPMRMLISL